MKKRDLNQSRLAERMDTTTGTISKLLATTGKYRMAMTDEWLVGFAEALDIEVVDLFRDPNRPTREELLEGLSDADTKKIISMIDAYKQAS